ncbi:MAG: hypothetical protein QNI84_15685 [Henriciella sp.]|nr:hypothetical protein [Henriciella sp.]
MILHGNARGGSADLARHLLRTDHNDMVTVHEVKGFMSEDVYEALMEIEALARGTRAQQHLFSMSFSPPKGANISTEDFERAADRAELALGLEGQSRVLIFHEKGDNRDRHMHAVWSRIDVAEMKAIPLPYNRMKMRDLSRSLFVEHGLEVPRGLIDRAQKHPLNFTMEEHQQAQRIGKNIRDIKSDLQNAWAVSDDVVSFKHALDERGFKLCRGDRRNYLVVDHQGEYFSLPKGLGLKTKAVRERLGDEAALPSLEDARSNIAQTMLPKLEAWDAQVQAEQAQKKAAFQEQRTLLVDRQRSERAAYMAAIDQRQVQETLERQARFRSSFAGLWDRLNGRHTAIKAQNEKDALAALARDRAEKDAFILQQMNRRQQLYTRAQAVQKRLREQRTSLKAETKRYKKMRLQFAQRLTQRHKIRR